VANPGVSVTLVNPAMVDGVWPHIRKGIESACLETGGDISPADIWRECRNGHCFLIVTHNGDAITAACIWRYEMWMTGPKLRCLALWGANMELWLGPMRDLSASIAKDCGATAFVTEGRKGWERIFPKARVLRVVYEEPL